MCSKALWRIVLTALAIFAFGACGATDTLSKPPADVSSQGEVEQWPLVIWPPSEDGPFIHRAPADLTDFSAVASTYLRPLMPGSGLLLSSWAAPADILADDLILFYCYNNLGGLPIYSCPDGFTYDPGNGDRPSVPAEQVEAALQRHFDVSAEHLRTSYSYNVDTQTYLMTDAFATPYSYVALSAEERGGIITITVGSDFDGSVSVMSELKLEIGEGNIVRYLSFEKAPQVPPNPVDLTDVNWGELPCRVTEIAMEGGYVRHPNQMSHADISGDTLYLQYWYESGTRYITAFDLHTGEQKASITTSPSVNFWLSDSELRVFDGDKIIRYDLELNPLEEIPFMGEPHQWNTMPCFSRDGGSLLYTDTDSYPVIYNIAAGESEPFENNLNGRYPSRISYFVDTGLPDIYVLIAGNAGETLIYDAAAGELISRAKNRDFNSLYIDLDNARLFKSIPGVGADENYTQSGPAYYAYVDREEPVLWVYDFAQTRRCAIPLGDRWPDSWALRVIDNRAILLDDPQHRETVVYLLA